MAYSRCEWGKARKEPERIHRRMEDRDILVEPRAFGGVKRGKCKRCGCRCQKHYCRPCQQIRSDRFWLYYAMRRIEMRRHILQQGLKDNAFLTGEL